MLYFPVTRLIVYLTRRFEISQNDLAKLLNTTSVHVSKMKRGATVPRRGFSTKLELLAAASNHFTYAEIKSFLNEAEGVDAVWTRTLVLLSMGHDPRGFNTTELPFTTTEPVDV